MEHGQGQLDQGSHATDVVWELFSVGVDTLAGCSVAFF